MASKAKERYYQYHLLLRRCHSPFSFSPNSLPSHSSSFPSVGSALSPVPIQGFGRYLSFFRYAELCNGIRTGATRGRCAKRRGILFPNLTFVCALNNYESGRVLLREFFRIKRTNVIPRCTIWWWDEGRGIFRFDGSIIFVYVAYIFLSTDYCWFAAPF